jgi:hypothetical protein
VQGAGFTTFARRVSEHEGNVEDAARGHAHICV